MAHYVKFLRGTPEAYNNLKQKNNDTLYFIYENDEATGALYLGSKLIAGSTDSDNQDNINTLKDLKDVLLAENINKDSFLVYDIKTAAWINKSLDELIFEGVSEDSEGRPGLVPKPEFGETDLFLKSDGTWGQPSINHTVLTIENSSQITHKDLINEITGEFDNISGDIIIIKDFISDNKWQYTAYVFEMNEWHAMDGNYNAENVYFDKDLITTTEIGNITLTDGRATIAAAGKNLREVFNSIFIQEKNPEVINPSAILTFVNNGSYEVGTEIEPSYKIEFNNGNYSYGPDTNISILGVEVKDSLGNIMDITEGKFNPITIGDTTNYSIIATISHSEGSIPNTNLDNKCFECQIKEGNISIVSDSLTGYRNSFYGTFNHKNELTSDSIRNLNPCNEFLDNGAVINVPIPLGAYRVVFAYPATLNDVISISDSNGLGAGILSSFTKTTIDVKGANEYKAIPYKVYYIDYANANDTVNSYIFKIGEGD